MNTQSVDEVLEAAENALRDFIQEVLEREYGDKWLEKCGMPEKRIKQWEEYRDKEKEKDISGIAEDRILYYSDFGDLRSIINRNWNLYEPCFKDKNRILSRLQELKAFRDTDAHRRDLLTHQKQIVLGYCGEIRTAIIRYRSKQTPEGEYFPKIEYAKDSFGNIAQPDGSTADTGLILRPGDEVEFVVKAWDPLEQPLQYLFTLFIGTRDALFGETPSGWTDNNRAKWNVSENHISANCRVIIWLRSNRPYHAHGDYDDDVAFSYKVLPKEPPKKE
jgi:hypothetical protein